MAKKKPLLTVGDVMAFHVYGDGFTTICLGDGKGNSILWPRDDDKLLIGVKIDAIQAQQIARVAGSAVGLYGATEVVRDEIIGGTRLIQLRFLI